MGCGVSRLDANGMVSPAKFRPVFLFRLEEMKMRRHARPLIKNSDSTPSKKELLLHDLDRDEDEKSPQKSPGKPKEEANYHKNENIKIKDEDVLSDAETDDGGDREEDEDDHDRRKIGRDDDGAFPGSPSFRVYFKDGGEGHENDAFKNTISSVEADSSSKERCEMKNKKVVKRGRKKGAMKNLLLNYKSCYHKSPITIPHHQSSNLLT